MYSRHPRALFKSRFIWPVKTKFPTIPCSSAKSSPQTFSLFRAFSNKLPAYHYYQKTVDTNYYSTSTALEDEIVDSVTFEKVCEETLHSLSDYFDELVETESMFENADVMYGAGVLTVDLGKYGTYVINRQSPNRQIWLSSPTSGPKRFDFSTKEHCWIYKHDGQRLHELLKKELETILGKDVTILKCSYSSVGENR